MGKVNKKYVGLIASAVLILCSIILIIGLFVKADEPATQGNQVEIDYEDDSYCDAIALDVENEIVQDIYEQYQNGDLKLAVENNELSYKVDEKEIAKIEDVSSALCMEIDKTLEVENASLLYLGDKVDCKYDETSGEAVSEFDSKWLMLNGTQPLAMYNENEENGIKEYYTPAYINDDKEASNILVEVNSSGIVSIVGRVIDKDVDGNPLDEVQIEELKAGDTLCPAYVNYFYSVVNIEDSVVEATEVYNTNVYTYGTDFEITYDVLPDNYYYYSMRTNYKDDAATEDVETDYGFFTEPKQISIVNEDIVEVNDTEITSEGLEGYDYMGVFKFLKTVWEHRKANTKEEFKQTYSRETDNGQKGYISTWNSLGINKALRTDTVNNLDEDDKKTITTLDAMCKKTSSKDNCLMLRRVAADYLTTVFGVKALNGEALSDEMVKAYSDEEKKKLETELQSIVGDKMVEKGFMSASILPKVNIMFLRTVEIVIKVPAGSSYYVTHNVVESEAIFPTNTELTVESVKYDESREKYIITTMLSQNL